LENLLKLLANEVPSSKRLGLSLRRTYQAWRRAAQVKWTQCHQPLCDRPLRFQPPPLPPNETERLAELHSYNLLDTLPEPLFDDLTALASYICDAPISLISLVDDCRQWFKSKVGIEANETSREISFCAHTFLQPHSILVVSDTYQDDRFADHPLVLGSPYIRFYAGMPLLSPNGLPLGTLCVADTIPRRLSPNQLSALQRLSGQVVAQMELIREVHKRQQAEQQIRQQSLTDELTGLYNRRGFFLLAEQQLQLARRMEMTSWLIFIDLDKFKQINDSLGHAWGDMYLVDTANLLKQHFRTSDAIARLGGDEFVVLASGNFTDVREIHDRIQAGINTYNQHCSVSQPLSVSIGIEQIDPSQDTTLQEILNRADKQMYMQKRLKQSLFPLS